MEILDSKTAGPAIAPSIGKALFKDMSWRGLRPLQENSSTAIRNGYQTLITAGTASGKTEAALLPVLSLILESPDLAHSRTPVALYVAPLKALINDIAERLKKLSLRAPLEIYAWHGDVEMSEKNEALKHASILVTTPESLEGLLVSSKIDPTLFFHNLRFFLLDEFHALLSSPRGYQLASQIERLQTYSRYEIQKIAMSATIGNPEMVLEWMRGSGTRECLLVSDSHQTQKQLMLRKKSYETLLADAQKVVSLGKKAILFTCSKGEAESLFHYLNRQGLSVLLHHGSIGKKQREDTERLFKGSDDYPIMIATTTLEMGIDIGDVSYVLFYSVPRSAASFMQRLGRAGRKTGVARALIYVPTDTEEEGKPLALDQTLEERLFLLGNLSLFSEGRVEPIEMKDYYPQLFAHQVISMVFREKQMDRRKIALLKAAYPFKGLQKEDVGAVLSFLEEENYLLRIDQEYRLGWKAKDRLEGAGIGDFLSVFSSSEDWTVVEGNREIGKVHAATVFHNKRKQGHEVFIQNFYLAGKAWKVLSVDAARRRISVQRAESGAKPLWLSGEDAVHPVFSEAIRRFILKPTFSPSCVWDPEVQDTLLKTIAGELYTVSHEERWVPVMVERKKGADIHLYTYAGTLLNDLLALLVRQYAPQSRDVRSTWRVIRWKAYAPFHPEEFKDWITSLSYEEFYGLTEDEFTRNEPKFYGKVFPDCLREYIPASLSVNALIRHYWGLLQSSVRSGGLTSDA